MLKVTDEEIIDVLGQLQDIMLMQAYEIKLSDDEPDRGYGGHAVWHKTGMNATITLLREWPSLKQFIMTSIHEMLHVKCRNSWDFVMAESDEFMSPNEFEVFRRIGRVKLEQEIDALTIMLYPLVYLKLDLSKIEERIAKQEENVLMGAPHFTSLSSPCFNI